MVTGSGSAIFTPEVSRKTNFRGEPRCVGVEIEFADISARSAGTIVQQQFGGDLREVDPHRILIEDTALGDFTAELDLQYAHRLGDAYESDADDRLSRGLEDVLDRFSELIGDVGSVLVPCEIVCPPIRLEDLPRIDCLLTALRRAGAHGTGDNPIYAFGAQLNPDIADKGADYQTAMLKAYLLMSAWLRAEISVDLTRRLLAFADPFPKDYARLVIEESYWPEQNQLIDDYLAYNPTRNRELDMLPLFTWLDEERVRRTISDPRVKKRPTFHYRLPDAQLDDPQWTIQQEWVRWSQVECLADHHNDLTRMGHAYLENEKRIFPKDWAEEVGSWVLQ